jgi:hypothetical protein
MLSGFKTFLSNHKKLLHTFGVSNLLSFFGLSGYLATRTFNQQSDAVVLKDYYEHPYPEPCIAHNKQHQIFYNTQYNKDTAMMWLLPFLNFYMFTLYYITNKFILSNTSKPEVIDQEPWGDTCISKTKWFLDKHQRKIYYGLVNLFNAGTIFGVSYMAYLQYTQTNPVFDMVTGVTRYGLEKPCAHEYRYLIGTFDIDNYENQANTINYLFPIFAAAGMYLNGLIYKHAPHVPILRSSSNPNRGLLESSNAITVQYSSTSSNNNTEQDNKDKKNKNYSKLTVRIDK